jgi:hypothetical protein
LQRSARAYLCATLSPVQGTAGRNDGQDDAREAKFAWKDLRIMNGGEKVTVNMTKDQTTKGQLKTQPEYKYPNTTRRGQVCNDSGIWKDRPSKSSPTLLRRPEDVHFRRFAVPPNLGSISLPVNRRLGRRLCGSFATSSFPKPKPVLACVPLGQPSRSNPD